MTEPKTQQEALNQAIDRETRQVMGDLMMQTIILKQVLNLTQQPQPVQPPANPVPPQPEPIPPQPEQPPPRQSMNGGAKREVL